MVVVIFLVAGMAKGYGNGVGYAIWGVCLLLVDSFFIVGLFLLDRLVD
jgi:hypothetical protein